MMSYRAPLGALSVACLCMSLVATPTWAARGDPSPPKPPPAPAPRFCVQLFPFIDTLTLESAAALTPPTSPTGVKPAITVEVVQEAPERYRLEGGGTAVFSPNRQFLLLQLLLFNDSAAFDSNRIGAIRLTLDTHENAGEWFAEYVASPDPGVPAIQAQGLAHPVDCEGLGLAQALQLAPGGLALGDR